MEIFSKVIDGVVVKKPLNEIVIATTEVTIFNPSEAMVLEHGWERYVTPNISEEDLLKEAKNLVLHKIRMFDASKDVNECFILIDGQAVSYWADKGTRNNLKAAVQVCMSVGRTTYRLDLRELGVSLNIPCETLIQMLQALEIYAIDCYNRTTDHIYAVNKLGSREEVYSYDYHLGYPQKLTFDVY